MSDTAPSGRRERLLWLDMLRLLAILDILGFHWVRTCAESGRYGLHWAARYIDTANGFGQLQYSFADKSGALPSSLINNGISAVFGLGWQSVNVFILLSGLGLAMHYRPHAPGFSLSAWIAHRFRRILVPLWSFALILILAGEAFLSLAANHGGTLGNMAARLAEKNLPDSLPTELLIHAVLVDPRGTAWAPHFFAPCWWFIPPLLVGYLVFPLLWRAIERFGLRIVLPAMLAVSATAWQTYAAGLFYDHSWYFVVLHEGVNFTLGIAAGRFMSTEAGRARVTALLADWQVIAAAALLFVAGNIANWFPAAYPIASALFTAPLTILMGAIALKLSRLRVAVSICRAVDPYYLYLLHQPLVWPMVLLTASIAGRAALPAGFSLGLIAFIGLAMAVVVTASRAARLITILGQEAHHLWRPAPREARP